MGLFEDLEWRGLVHTASEGLAELLERQRVVVYAGFDPTARSLHVGSLMPLLALARLQRAGHSPIAVVGGGTGMIGDPSGKTKERQLLDHTAVADNVRGIREQVGRFLDVTASANAAEIIDNGEWLASIRLIDFLRDVGKHFTVNSLLAKESIKRRVESETGISFTEFTYLLLQAFDFLVLNEQKRAVLQVGGSDQWGNITAGIDLIRARTGGKAHGLVFPLVTTSAGVKFGKTEAGAVWLDPALTSPFRFYQFWLATDDRDVVRYLKYFTFLERPAIEELERAHQSAPHERAAHKALATEVTRLVHGDEGLARATRATQVFFGGDFQDLPVEEVLDVFADVPSAEVARAALEGEGLALADALLLAQAAPSKKEARRAIEGGGISVNNQKQADPNARLSLADAFAGRLIVLRKGKKSVYLLRIA